MLLKINGKELDCELSVKGELYKIGLDNDKCPFDFVRGDKCELQLGNNVFLCAVVNSKISLKYGKSRKRMLVLRADEELKQKPKKAPAKKNVEEEKVKAEEAPKKQNKKAKPSKKKNK